ncbi:Uncharacterised protein [uncultured archaeon]|nr:Uncharacterised protein [uncultured archaeon]
MRFINLLFTKLSAERLKDKASEIKFNTKIDITSIDSIKSDFVELKEEILKINFIYAIQYEPDFANLELAGSLILSLTPEMTEGILKEWEEKKIPEDFRIFVFNIILKKSNLKALELEDELNLPLHLPFPSLVKDKNQKKED